MFRYLKIISIFLLIFSACSNKKKVTEVTEPKEQVKPQKVDLPDPIVKKADPVVGAARLMNYINGLYNGKQVAVVVNQTSMVNDELHLVDLFVGDGIQIKKIFAPEHGFRGTADAGEQIKDGKDAKTGIPVMSLYGKKKKPTAEDLKGIEIIVFDIQDVGARFYTYISSMHYVMEACAENNIPFLVLDRPNPNGHYVDGPIRAKGFESFVGMHPIPIVHGMTVGEIAQMINGEGWLKGGLKCDLEVVPCKDYDHKTFYELPVKPSPNLPNSRSIYLYPSLCLLEATEVSIGRGTRMQFQLYGHPSFTKGDFTFVPIPMEGAKHPKLQDKECKGFDLRKLDLSTLQNTNQINLDYLLNAYDLFPDKENFFLKNLFFDKLAGTDALRKQVIAGKSEAEIRASWADGLADFKEIRKQYLLYADF